MDEVAPPFAALETEHTEMGTATNRGRSIASRTVSEVRQLRGCFGAPEFDTLFWSLAAVAMLADVGLTVHGQQLGLVELNPIARLSMASFGFAGLVYLKAGAAAVAIVGWSLLPEHQRWTVPLALALPWSSAAFVNLGLILAI